MYNKQSLPLNEKVTGKGNFENTLQLVIEAVVFIVPTFIATVLSLFLGDTIAYTILLVVGILFTVSHPIWLRNSYQRMMTRKYQNMEGFHATR